MTIEADESIHQDIVEEPTNSNCDFICDKAVSQSPNTEELYDTQMSLDFIDNICKDFVGTSPLSRL